MLRNIRLTTLDMMRRPAFVSSVLRMLRDAFGLQPTENKAGMHLVPVRVGKHRHRLSSR